MPFFRYVFNARMLTSRAGALLLLDGTLVSTLSCCLFARDDSINLYNAIAVAQRGFLKVLEITLTNKKRT